MEKSVCPNQRLLTFWKRSSYVQVWTLLWRMQTSRYSLFEKMQEQFEYQTTVEAPNYCVHCVFSFDISSPVDIIHGQYQTDSFPAKNFDEFLHSRQWEGVSFSNQASFSAFNTELLRAILSLDSGSAGLCYSSWLGLPTSSQSSCRLPALLAVYLLTLHGKLCCSVDKSDRWLDLCNILRTTSFRAVYFAYLRV